MLKLFLNKIILSSNFLIPSVITNKNESMKLGLNLIVVIPELNKYLLKV